MLIQSSLPTKEIKQLGSCRQCIGLRMRHAKRPKERGIFPTFPTKSDADYAVFFTTCDQENMMKFRICLSRPSAVYMHLKGILVCVETNWLAQRRQPASEEPINSQ